MKNNLVTPFPETIHPELLLTAKAFDELRTLLTWIGTMPDYVELSEHTWDRINEVMTEATDVAFEQQVRAKQRAGWWCDSAQINPDGCMVALFNHDSFGPKDPELQVYLIRGEDEKPRKRRKSK